MSSGGSCRSQSIWMAASPRASEKPVWMIERWKPKLREKRNARTRGSRAASATSSSQVPSVLRLSVKTSSRS